MLFGLLGLFGVYHFEITLFVVVCLAGGFYEWVGDRCFFQLGYEA